MADETKKLTLSVVLPDGVADKFSEWRKQNGFSTGRQALRFLVDIASAGKCDKFLPGYQGGDDAEQVDGTESQ